MIVQYLPTKIILIYWGDLEPRAGFLTSGPVWMNTAAAARLIIRIEV